MKTGPSGQKFSGTCFTRCCKVSVHTLFEGQDNVLCVHLVLAESKEQAALSSQQSVCYCFAHKKIKNSISDHGEWCDYGEHCKYSFLLYCGLCAVANSVPKTSDFVYP